MYASNIVDSLSALQGLHVEPDQECFSSLFHCEQSNDKTQISVAVHSNLFKSENTHANTPECLIILQKKNNSSYFPGRWLKALVRDLQFLISTALLVAACKNKRFNMTKVETWFFWPWHHRDTIVMPWMCHVIIFINNRSINNRHICISRIIYFYLLVSDANNVINWQQLNCKLLLKCLLKTSTT